MGASRHGSVFAVAAAVAVAASSSAACTFGIDTSGLTGAGGQTEAGADVVTADVVTADVVTADSDARTGRPDASHRDATRADGGGRETGAADSSQRDAGGFDGHVVDATMMDSGGGDSGERDAGPAPCSMTSVQAIPGTLHYQVMVDGGTDTQGLTEDDGDLLVAVAYGGQGVGQTTPISTQPNMTFSVTDTLDNTYFAGPMYENTNSNQAAIQIFYAPNIKAGANTVTVVATAGAAPFLMTGLFLQEFSGVAKTDVVDVSAGQMAPSSTAAVQPGNMTTSAACDLIVAAFADGHVDPNFTGLSGWTLRSSDQWDPAGAEDDAPLGVLAHSSVNPLFALSTGADNGWVAAQMAFRGASTSPSGQPNEVGVETPARTVSVGACSAIVTVSSMLGGGGGVETTATGIHMSLGGSGLTFYADSSCAYPITSLLIGAGRSSASFYFKGSTMGSISLSVSPPTGVLGANQSQTVN